jgi:DNA-binding MarR family transcriptional regulator
MAKSAAGNVAQTASAASAARAPQGCTNFKLRTLLRRVARLYDAELSRAGLKGTQYSLLSHIVRLGPVRPQDLARQLGMDASTLTRNLRVVIAEGWVAQGPGEDERSRSVTITPAGRAKQGEARRYWRNAQDRLNELLGIEQVAQLHALIDVGLERLDAPGDAA